MVYFEFGHHYVYEFLPSANEVWDKVMFSEPCVSHSVHKGGGGSLYDFTNCLPARSHVSSRESLSLVPCSSGGGGGSLSRGVSAQRQPS